MMRVSLLAAVAAISLFGSEANAATQIVNSAGKLTGATGVIVNGQSYDVSFVQGSCFSVYGSCSTSKFDFNNKDDASAAARSLMEQVFIDTAFGNFDTDPSLTFGCSGSSCDSMIPYEPVSVAPVVFSAVAFNFKYEKADRIVDRFASEWRADGGSNYARFSIAAAVPEPATWVMMLTGFGMVAGLSRYRRRTTKMSCA